jgi:hypothetical protein
MNTLLWTFTIVLGAPFVLQGVVLRVVYRRKVAFQHARHRQLQQAMDDKLEKTKRQIGQLQNDLTAARQQIKQLGEISAASVQGSLPTRQVLERELDAASASRRSLPVDGFADTQTSAEVTLCGSLLFQ